MRREILWQGLFASLGGLLLGAAVVGILPQISNHSVWTLSVAFLAGLAAWVEVRVEPHGVLDLSPAVFLVTSVAFSRWEGVITAVVAPLLVLIMANLRSSSNATPGEMLTRGGEAALSLVVASLVLDLLPPNIARANQWSELLLLATFSLLLGFLLQVLRISAIEGVKLRRLLAPLIRNSFPHYLSLLAGVLTIWATFSLIGPLGIVLATVVVIEMYYPWKLLGEQKDLFMKSLQMISNAVDVKDPYTAHHSRRVSGYAVMMARALDVPEEEVERIRIGALMHDIGKIGVRSDIIRKPSKLTDEEMDLMKGHVAAGASIVGELEILNKSTDIVQHHHENFDGTGYPGGLAGKEIPLGSRIVLVADAFDALTTDRPYRKGRSMAEAFEVLEAHKHTQFDPIAVETLRKVVKSIP